MDYKSYLEMTKPRIVTLVLVTTFLGFVLAKGEIESYYVLLMTLIGTACTCGGSGVLNHFLEREVDCKMERTRNRPIPSGKVSPANALAFGLLLVILGCTLLVWQVNTLTGFLALLTTFLYVVVYTPLKQITWLNTMIGAIPGALPTLGGWAAASNGLELGGWALFAILFIWQHPHFYAIAWIFRDDYAKGGFKMLPVVDPEGERLFKHILYFSLLLIPASILPAIHGTLGLVYLICAFFLSIWMLIYSYRFFNSATKENAWKLFRATIIYLPALLLVVAIDLNLAI
ncbi:MAG: heme o synthase [Bdellovibrionales bacterium]|nr:heme o synthase [Bdellovibrionales bacterium]